jgi:hypothetical protein
MPELAEASKHIMVEETKEGLNVDLVDQEGRSMFPEGSKEPYERTRRIIEKLAGPLKATPYRVSITGHTSASKVPPKADYGPWNLSADRANSVRQILEEEGFPLGNIYEVCWSRGYRSAISRGSLHCGESPGDHYAHARGAAGSARAAAVGSIHRLKEYCTDSLRHICVVNFSAFAI